MMVRKIGIIGCGAIGEILAKAVDTGETGDSELEVLFDLEKSEAEELSEKLSTSPKVTNVFDDVVDDDEVDVVVEAASQEAVHEYGTDILESGKDFIILSVGAFAKEGFKEEITKAAKANKRNVFIPSGAILGLDGVEAAEIAGLDKAKIKTRKPPGTLSKTKFVKQNDIDLSELTEPELIFEGPASEAVEAFPGSVNVAASLSLAGIGLENTMVEIVADPSLDQNVHKIDVKGEAGELMAEAHNFSSPENPKTSYLAALSAIKVVKKLTDPIKLGT